MRNPNDKYVYREIKCIRCGNKDVYEASECIPSGLIIEPHEPCGQCGEESAYIGPMVSLEPTPRLETYFNRGDVLLH